jgi:hypothetical protein
MSLYVDSDQQSSRRTTLTYLYTAVPRYNCGFIQSPTGLQRIEQILRS